MKNNTISSARYRELSDRSYNENRFTFTCFLGLDEQSELIKLTPELSCYTLWGGADDCERVVARFGSADELGYNEDYPIVCIKASPLSAKFADDLSHRDFLGALMSLGIERSTLGDIAVIENSAYIFCLDNMADYICDNLTQVKHTSVSCEKTELPHNAVLFRTKEKEVNIASYRADCLVAAAFNLSRSKVDAYFSAEQVFINGKACSKSAVPKENDKISVRHLGKFRIAGQTGVSRKGRYFTIILIYI